MLHIAICDDDLCHTKNIMAMIGKYKTLRPDTEVIPCSYNSGDELLESLNNGSDYNIFLLDILMPGLNGIELAREIRNRLEDVAIVFLTSSTDYALDAFRVYAAQYILKPVDEDELFRVFDKTVTALRLTEDQFFLFATPGCVIKIPFSSIVCVELYGRLLKLYHENGSVLHSKSIRLKFEDAVSSLFADRRFLCSHKSFIINMQHVEELTGTAFIMKHGLGVPIPRYKYSEAKAKYFAWLSECGKSIVGGSIDV